ncbi:MAG: L-fuconolactonase [Planctomycetota bacterium]|jgi:L-fuconolactonase
MRIDAHQHFWTYDAGRYPWIGPELQDLARDFGPTDLAPLLRAESVDGSIAVQARQDLEEIVELLVHAEKHAEVLGVVGWIDLSSDKAASQLDLFDCKHLLGLRHVLQDEPDDNYMLGAAFQRGLGLLAARDLVYDILIHPRHLTAAVQLVDAHPNQVFVLDHLAKPFIKSGEIEPWREHLAELARRPQVSIKLSGLVTEADWASWTTADLVPYLDAALEAFGPERVMFGSDWPVCTLAASYSDVCKALRAWADAQGSSLQSGLWGENAARIYGIER